MSRNIAIFLITALQVLLDAFIFGAFAYAVFILGRSPWWIAVAVIIMCTNVYIKRNWDDKS